MRFFTPTILLLSISAFSQIDCSLKLNKDSIQVYTCSSESSKYKTIKTNFTLTATPHQLIAMLMDIDHLGNWQYRTASAKLLKTINDREIIYYTEVSAPAISNRDFIIHLKIEERLHPKEWIITANSLPDYVPIKKNVVRIPLSKAIWKIKELQPGKLTVEYVIDIDFGGAIPALVVNTLSHKAPYETFKSMREQIGSYPIKSKK